MISSLVLGMAAATCAQLGGIGTLDEQCDDWYQVDVAHWVECELVPALPEIAVRHVVQITYSDGIDYITREVVVDDRHWTAAMAEASWWLPLSLEGAWPTGGSVWGGSPW